MTTGEHGKGEEDQSLIDELMTNCFLCGESLDWVDAEGEEEEARETLDVSDPLSWPLHWKHNYEEEIRLAGKMWLENRALKAEVARLEKANLL